MDHENLQAHTALAAITVFAVLFFLLTAVSGLGGKPRPKAIVPVTANDAAMASTSEWTNAAMIMGAPHARLSR